MSPAADPRPFLTFFPGTAPDSSPSPASTLQADVRLRVHAAALQIEISAIRAKASKEEGNVRSQLSL